MQIHRNLSAHITVLLFPFAKDEKGAALREDVDKALIEIKNDGILAEILTKYFGKDTSPADDDLKATPN